MKIFKCDICGREFDPVKEKGGHLANWSGGEPNFAGVIIRGVDACKECIGVAKEMNFRAAMISAWRDAVHESE